jgi:hypothetical protein
MEDRDPDGRQADHEAAARKRLLDAGASSLSRAPWLHKSQPPAAVELIHFALWCARAGDIEEELLMAALTLLPAARAEVDQVEAAVLLTARSHGLSWPQISRAMGLASAQAGQQRFGRVTGRVESRVESRRGGA